MLKRAVKSVLDRLGYSITKREYAYLVDSPFSFEAMLYRRIVKQGHCTFIQIGANDGISFDPLHKLITHHKDRMSGIVVEPLYRAFEQLCRTYQSFPNIVKINAAIHNSQSEMVLYTVSDDALKTLPAYSHGIASFDKDHHALTGTPPECIVAETVRCISLGTLLDDYDVRELDLLLLDTEGYDAEILLNLDFDRIKPALIRFEHGLRHGVMTPATFKKILCYLNRNGYQVMAEDYDATAYQPLSILEGVL